jgi:hypothetical protein
VHVLDEVGKVVHGDAVVADVTQRWPDGFVDADNKNAFMIPTMG